VIVDANGGLVSKQMYKPWGETRSAAENGVTKYQYTGQYSYASEFGLLFYNARWLDSSLGRFAQADSIVPGGVQGLDRYAYANNSPVRYTDPSGHESGDCYDRGYCWKFSAFSTHSNFRTVWAQQYGRKSYGGYLQTYAIAGIGFQNPYGLRPPIMNNFKRDGIYTGEGIAKVTDAEMRTPYGAEIFDGKGKRGVGLGMPRSDQNDPLVAVEAMMTRILLRTSACDDKCKSTDIFLAAALGQNGPGFNPEQMGYLTHGEKYKPREDGTHSLQWGEFLTNIKDPKKEQFNRDMISEFASNVLLLQDQGWDVPNDIDWSYVYSLTVTTVLP
jgi:RHS repeat-associated protein